MGEVPAGGWGRTAQQCKSIDYHQALRAAPIASATLQHFPHEKWRKNTDSHSLRTWSVG